SSSFDLAIATAVLSASGQIPAAPPADTLVLGELGLDGGVRAIRGAIGALLSGRAQGYKTFYIPKSNLEQAKLVPGITVVPVDTLRNLYLDLTGTVPIHRIDTKDGSMDIRKQHTFSNDFRFIV